MANRFPPKGTLPYRRYWRDRRVMDEIETTTREVQHCAEDTDPQRQEYYNRALRLMREAHAAMKEGWKL